MWTHGSEEPMHLTAIAASPDGSRVGLAASDGFKLLDAKTGKSIDGSTPADGAADKNENPKDKPISSPKPKQVPDAERDAAVEVKAAPAGKQKVLTPEEATRKAEGSKLIVEFKVKSEAKKEGWATGHGPDDWCLRPGYPKDMAQARFLSILTPNAITQLNRAGIRDIEKHFSGKTVRVTGPIVKQDYRGRGTPLEVEIVIDDVSQLEVAK
jgi:hypothetical protein